MIIGSMLAGSGSLPFLICSSLGYTMGSCFATINQTQSALQAMLLYPDLLRACLLEQYPNLAGTIMTSEGWHRWRAQAIGRDEPFGPLSFRLLGGDWPKRGQAVIAWVAARPAIEQIQSERVQSLINRYALEAPSLPASLPSKEAL